MYSCFHYLYTSNIENILTDEKNKNIYSSKGRLYDHDSLKLHWIIYFHGSILSHYISFDKSL